MLPHWTKRKVNVGKKSIANRPPPDFIILSARSVMPPLHKITSIFFSRFGGVSLQRVRWETVASKRLFVCPHFARGLTPMYRERERERERNTGFPSSWLIMRPQRLSSRLVNICRPKRPAPSLQADNINPLRLHGLCVCVCVCVVCLILVDSLVCRVRSPVLMPARWTQRNTNCDSSVNMPSQARFRPKVSSSLVLSACEV